MMKMRIAVLGFVLLFAMGDGCSSGVVGVQDYGTVSGRVLDATTNKPIANAIVSVGSIYTATADAQGAFAMPRIPIGDQDVTARAPGYVTASTTVEILKNHTKSVGYLRLVPVTKPDSVPTLLPPATPTPEPESPQPSASPTTTAAPTPTPTPAT